MTHSTIWTAIVYSVFNLHQLNLTKQIKQDHAHAGIKQKQKQNENGDGKACLYKCKIEIDVAIWIS